MNNFSRFRKAYLVPLRLCVGVLVLFAAMMLGLGEAAANGTGTVVREEVVGPYHVRVGISPFPAQVGRTTMSISVEDSGGEPVPQSDIVALVRGPAQSPQGDLTMDFGNDPWDLVHYHAAVELVDPGTWTFDIHIDGQLGEADIQLPIEFVPQIERAEETGESVPIIPMAVLAAVVVISVIIGLLLRFATNR